MDSKIMAMIDKDVNRCRVLKKGENRYLQYNETKKRLSRKYPGRKEYEYIGKAVAKKYRV